MTHDEILSIIKSLNAVEMEDAIILFKISKAETKILNITNLKKAPIGLKYVWVEMVLSEINKEYRQNKAEDTIKSVSEAGRSVSFGEIVPSAKIVKEYEEEQKFILKQLYAFRVT